MEATTLPPTRLYTVAEVWAAEFEPRHRAARQQREEQRTEAFLDVELTLAGEPVRQLTPHDMLLLDALGNPFIAGSPDGTVAFIDCAGFIWQLHPANTHTSSLANLWRRHRVLKRLARYSTAELAPQIVAYVDRMLGAASDQSPPDGTGFAAHEPRTYFLAPLLMNVAADIGHVDPLSGRLLAHVPVLRLIQYGRAICDAKQPQTSAADEALVVERVRCAQRTNELNWEFLRGRN